MPKIVLTTESASHFGLTAGHMNIGRFSGGEISLSIKENIKDSDIFIVGSTNAPAENLIELLFAIDTASRIGAKSITAVVPYFGYARADREKFPGDSVSARIVSRILEIAGGSNFSMCTVNIHSPHIKDFFAVPFYDIDTTNLFTEKFKGMDAVTIIAPDEGASQKAKEFGQNIGVERIAIIHKERLEDGSVEIKGIEGEIKHRVIIIDDMVDSGATIVKGIEFLKSRGVDEVYLAATHMVWPGGGYKKIAEIGIVKKIYTTDTIKPPADLPSQIEVVSISPLLQKFIYG